MNAGKNAGKNVSSRHGAKLVTLCLAAVLASSAQAQHLPEPGATPGVELINISKVPHDKFISVFPMVAVSRGNPDLVAVAWRQWNLPSDTDAPDFNAQCHLSLSRDGGKTFHDTDLMPLLRTAGGTGGVYEEDADGMPHLKGCNAPYVAIATDGTIYAGGSVYTTLGTGPSLPPVKAGRVGISVSTDGGASFSKLKVGIRMDHFAPGLTGLNGSTIPNPGTPWDGAGGAVDPQTGTFYSTTRAYVAATDDKGATFGTVYASKGTASASFGTLVASSTVQEFQGAKCPCLIVSTSTDKGKDWTDHLVAQASQYDPTGQVRYPVPAANPAKAGSYAVAVYAPDHRSIKLFYSDDYGASWKMAAPKAPPPSIIFTTVKQAAVGYTSDGKILVTWRAWRNVAAHNSFVAMLDGDSFGPTIKVNPALSIDPPSSFDTWYNGDFLNWVTGNKTDAFVAFVYAPGGQDEDTWLAKVPLRLLKQG
jgi:hypothetical protein